MYRDAMRSIVALALASIACGNSSSAPDASADAANDAIDAGPAARANGTVGAWQTLAPMPNARANFCATVVGSFVVVVGGNFPDEGGFTKLDAIHVARFHDDGSLDAWQLAGHAPSPVTECTAAGVGDSLYVLDGIYDDTSDEGQSFVATLSDQGALSAFTNVGALPSGIDLFDDIAFATTTTLVAPTSELTGTCDLLGAPIATSLAWTDVVFASEFRGRPQWATATSNGATFVYALGGYSDADSGNTVLATGLGARVNDDGSAGASFSVTPLPTPTTFGTAAWADDFVFVIGGRDGVFSGTPLASVLSAQSSQDGTLSSWSAQPPLPDGRTNVCAVVAGNFLYVLGGAAAAATDTVYAAQVRY